MQEASLVSMRVLGRFAVTVDAAPGSEIRISSRKAAALLAYLAMHPERRASREHLATFLWGDRRDEHARQSLRQCLLTLRRDLAQIPGEILLVEPHTVGLHPHNITIDAVDFVALSESADTAELERAAALYRGEFLAEFNLDEPFDAWARKTRMQLDGIAANVFHSCARLAEARGEGRTAIRFVERLIELDPLREDWQRFALPIYARFRSRESAAAHAEGFVALLKTELGVEPEPATVSTIEAIKRTAIPAESVWLQNIGMQSAAVAAEAPVLAPVLAPSLETIDAPDLVDPSGANENLAVLMSRLYGRVARWSLGPTASITVACLLSISAIGLMLAGPKIGTRSVAIAATKPADADLVSVRRAAANGSKLQPTPGLVPILVLPFTADDGSDGPHQKIADVLSDDLINTLSRFAAMRVISRQTAFTYKGRPVDIADVGAELGVRYAVEGSFHTADSKLVANVELVDTANRLQVWSDRVEWDGSDRFKVQDGIATRIARELKAGVTIAAGERSSDERAQEPDIDSLVMQGLALYYRSPSRENLAQQVGLFEEALRRDPDLQPAMVGAAMALTTGVLDSLTNDPEHDLDRAEALLDRAQEKTPNSYQVQCWKGMVYRARGDYQTALRSLSKCIDINPSATYGHSQIAEILTRLGRPAEGLDYIQYAMRLSPKDPFIGEFYVVAGEAELELRHDEAAAEWFRRAIAAQPSNPSGYLYLSATCALMGDKSGAAKSWDEFRKLSAAPAREQLIARLKAGAIGARDTRLDQGLRLASAS
jgi:DNA-binding SARP family transcriptional activator/TolB-like protein/Tfp pilus assembly protein PilF